MSWTDKQALEELKKQVQPLIQRLKDEKKLITKDIAAALSKNEAAVFKWGQGVSFPNNKEVRTVVEKLMELLGKPDNLNNPGEAYERKHSMVSIFFSVEQKTENYTGNLRTIGTVTNVNGMEAIISYPNDSIQFEDADGLVPMLDHGGEPSVRYGVLIAIKKIELNYCRSGNQYYIIDKANQPFLRTLYKENEKYRLVAENSNRYPDLLLDVSEIAAIFKVIISTGKPKPNINIFSHPDISANPEQ